MTLMINIFLSILIFSLCFSHHNLLYNVWQESYINSFFALLCLQLAVFSIQKIRFSSSSLFVYSKAGLPISPVFTCFCFIQRVDPVRLHGHIHILLHSAVSPCGHTICLRGQLPGPASLQAAWLVEWWPHAKGCFVGKFWEKCFSTSF